MQTINDFCGVLRYPAIAAIGEFYVKPAGATLNKLELGAGVQRGFETGRVILPVALIRHDFRRNNNAG